VADPPGPGADDPVRAAPAAARGARLPRQPGPRPADRGGRKAVSDAASEGAPATPRPARPGFGFARRHGVALTGWRDGAAEIACRADAGIATLAELRRHFAAPLRLTTLDAPAFERLLR